MTWQASVELRNNQLNSISTTVGPGGFLQVYDNSAGKPINVAAPRLGVLLLRFTCSSPFAPSAINGILLPTLPAQVNAIGNGTALYYSIFKNDGTTCVYQDDVVASGNGLVLNPSNDAIVVGLPENVNSWSITQGGA